MGNHEFVADQASDLTEVGDVPPSSISRAATSDAEARARAVVVATPRTATRAPQTATIHQPALLAVANPLPTGPTNREDTTLPMIATPMDWPTKRLVDAIADATPPVRGHPGDRRGGDRGVDHGEAEPNSVTRR